MTWKIWCQVSGGITGSRAAWLKSGGNGQEATFATREEAESVAAELAEHANGNTYHSASFSYIAKEVTDDPLDALIREYITWNAQHGLTLGSADEHLHDENLTSTQRAYLRDFCRRWNDAS